MKKQKFEFVPAIDSIEGKELPKEVLDSYRTSVTLSPETVEKIKELMKDLK